MPNIYDSEMKRLQETLGEEVDMKEVFINYVNFDPKYFKKVLNKECFK